MRPILFLNFVLSMKSKKLTLSAISLLTLSILALGGCQSSGTETTSTTNTTGNTASTTGSTAAAGEVKTPADAKNVQKANIAGVDTTTYMTAAATEKACGDQAKMVTDAGWKASSTTPSPVQVSGSWSQVFENDKKMLTLACIANPAVSGETMVTMTIAENMMQ